MEEDALIEQCRARLGQVAKGTWRLDALIGVGGMAAVYASSKPDFSMAAVNIVLLLLLFFLLLGTQLSGARSLVDPARVTGLPTAPLPDPLIVMTTSGLSLDGSPGTMDEILGRLGEIPGPVYILAPADMPADRLLPLATALIQARRSVRLITRDGGG